MTGAEFDAEHAHLYGKDGSAGTGCADLRASRWALRELLAKPAEFWETLALALVREVFLDLVREHSAGHWLALADEYAEAGDAPNEAACRRHAWLLAQLAEAEAAEAFGDVYGREVA